MADFHTVETLASTPTNQVRARDFPALEEGNISFPAGRYLVDFKRRSDGSTNKGSFLLTHRIEGAPLIQRLIEKHDKVRFVCTISSPLSSFRSTQMSDAPRQVVEWDEDHLGEPPLFTPMIVVCTPFSQTLDSQRDGVHPLWEGRKVDFTPGMRVAVGNVVQLRSSVFPLLRFHEDESLESGQFQVKEETEGDFRFRVNLAPDLHRFLHYQKNDPSREHILTHVVTACLSLLKAHWLEDSEDESLSTFRSLEALAEQLQSQNLPDWTAEDFSPELVATKLRPHRVPDTSTQETEE